MCLRIRIGRVGRSLALGVLLAVAGAVSAMVLARRAQNRTGGVDPGRDGWAFRSSLASEAPVSDSDAIDLSKRALSKFGIDPGRLVAYEYPEGHGSSRLVFRRLGDPPSVVICWRDSASRVEYFVTEEQHGHEIAVFVEQGE